MDAITKQEIQAFWRDLVCLTDICKPVFLQNMDWQKLECIQSIERIIQSLSANDPMSVSQIAQIAPLLKRFEVCEFSKEFEFLSRFTDRYLDVIETHAPVLNHQNEALARRLFAMHRYLDGESGAEDFKSIYTDRNHNIYYGLGLNLKDGTLLRFLSHLLKTSQNPKNSLIYHHFSKDAPELIEAINGGQACLEYYFNAHSILRYDSVLSKNVVSLSDDLQNRFNHLGIDPKAQQAQVDILTGNRFYSAQKQAKSIGIQSLRGFAMLFDLGQRTDDKGIATDITSESQRCLSLADAVITRMHGPMAMHWKSRLQSVFEGSGFIDGRIYDETRFFGQNTENLHWETAQFSCDDDPISHTPEPGYTYIVCPGDRLSRLAEKAYNGKADYRFILRQNPHILHPEDLEPGTRLYFPEIHQPQDINPQDPSISEAHYSEQSKSITYASREITAIAPLTDAQIIALCEGLNAIPEHQLYHTTVLELPVGLAIVCQRVTLLISDEHNERQCSSHFSDNKSPLLFWAHTLAAQIRGDIILRDDLTLPLACLSSQSYRQAWGATALNRLLQDKASQPPKFVIHTQPQCVDILSAHDEIIMRLEKEDFLAIRQQPNRRLTDYIATPVVQMTELTQLWLANLFEIPMEMMVPPFLHAHPNAIVSPQSESQFLVPMGTPVYPIMQGTVIACGTFPFVGCGIIIRHHEQLYSRYASLSTICVQPGQQVNANTMIARSGSCQFEPQPMLRLECLHSTSEISEWEQFTGTAVNYTENVCHLWPRSPIFECCIRYSSAG